MNNTITEIESTLEETNSRISEAEEQISEMRDRMVGIHKEQNEGKRMNWSIASETFGTILNTAIIKL